MCIRDSLRGDRIGSGIGRMARHRAGIAEAEIHVLEAVHINKMAALRLGDENRKRSGPFHHPVHRHAAKQRRAGAFEKRLRIWMFGGEAIGFVFGKVGETLAVNDAHVQRARGRSHPKLAQILEDFARGIVTRRAREPVAGMRALSLIHI